MATRGKDRDLAGDLAAGKIDLTELNAAIAEAGAAATTAEARKSTGLQSVTVADTTSG